MTSTYSLFALDEGGSPGGPDPTGTPEAPGTGPGARVRALRLAVATALAGMVVLLDELVIWAGQPSGDPTAATVARWYDAHATRVLLGDALWLAVCGLLVAAVWTAAGRFSGVPRWTARTVGLAATTALAVSSLFAAQIALGVGGDLTTWHLEGATYRAGTVLLALTMVPMADGLRLTPQRWLVAPAALVSLALLVPATGGLGLAAAFVLLGLVLGVPAWRSLPAQPPPRRPGAHR